MASAHIIEEMLYEIRRWDMGRDLTDVQLLATPHKPHADSKKGNGRKRA